MEYQIIVSMTHNGRMVSVSAESEVRTVAAGERWRGAGLREGTRKIIRLKVPLKRGKRRSVANFEREFIPC